MSKDKTKLFSYRLYSCSAVLLGMGFTWLFVSWYRSAVMNAVGTWGNSLLAGVGIGAGFALAYYAACVQGTETREHAAKLKFVSIALGFGCFALITVAIAITTGALSL
ncbi:hypothetical protein [Corynebacterium freiburgense]|uniref:hypothetical protein n=1 Tax=Corynebacterium freiburgense TaxID=556548 RepID=UPI0004209AD4|nr:hypothetical protein [Corynebacterium freiburgense]WJZ03311.1 hypothetical protein CFREI_10185 [Corynebacterium freiburgense]